MPRPAVATVLVLGWALAVAAVAAIFLRGTQSGVASAVAETADDPVAVSTAPADADPVVVAIEEGSGADAIVAQLVEAGVVDDPARLEALLAYSGVGAALRAGRYEFVPGTPAAEAVYRMRNGLSQELLFAVPEGLRPEEVGALALEAGVATPERWQAALDAASASGRAVLASRPEGATLNGYLFPASYPLDDDTTADDLVAAMLDAFEEAIADLQPDLAASELTLHEVLTLAAIVEREAVLPDEQPVVASVFLNRLADGIKLDADPTVQFAITEGASEQPEAGWWKRDLTLDDLAFDSPYNTYLVAGLPPGPIASPGLGAIEAVLHPAATDYYYFVARGDGSHVFSSTLEEHEANVERYLGR